jgi:hypothetical protein
MARTGRTARPGNTAGDRNDDIAAINIIRIVLLALIDNGSRTIVARISSFHGLVP